MNEINFRKLLVVLGTSISKNRYLIRLKQITKNFLLSILIKYVAEITVILFVNLFL